ncbi:mechanosensitive ion channel family protein [Marinobacter sp. X15-166B]|uniref:mechanosensitive ion channel family protein n=1 Tax=Marinobacter sp. X15-166B TaxID=1897620 RepID=UPI00085BB5C5|nr:mechanosensitive ion channel family protein [Marinobacter sp. X15-166B]OEY66856.1 mechanosensitive ion channel protein [Marinobacter sp. X15-166B]
MSEQSGLSVLGVFSGIQWEHWFSAIVLLLAGVVLASMSARWINHLMHKRASRHHAVLVRRLVFYAILVFFGIAAMYEAGFSMDVMLGAAGILTVAIGFASQTSASNMISGLFLLVESPFRIGEYIEVDGTLGEVVGVDVLSVKLRTPDNLYIRIPNETLIKTLVVNRSRFPIRRLDLSIRIAFAEDIERVEQLLMALAAKSPGTLEEPEPFVLVTGFGPSSVDLQFSFWVTKDNVREGHSDMMVAVKRMLDREGIEIPFPHTSIYAGSHSEPFRIELVTPQHNKEEEQDDVNANGGAAHRVVGH